jgi:ubiquinone/menaquinone biosynthesis C-methylase UbiE/uncharacterized protein YbaR (Trm112 family)
LRALQDVLRCSLCDGPYEVSPNQITCELCGRSFEVVDDIPVLLDEYTAGTALDRLDDYDAAMGINEAVIDQTRAEWKKILRTLGYRPRHALEIGSGTGVLTFALLEDQAVGRLTVTDVSQRFLQTLTTRLAQYPTPISLVACDANERHFRDGAFDLVVGRSVLHHLLDYEQALAQCRYVLQEGGAAVFYEPVLEGKTITTLFMALMLRCDEAMHAGLLSDVERDAVRVQIKNQMKSVELPQDRESLAKIEDKYIFEIDDLKQAGRDVGFTDVEFVEDARGLGYWPYLSHTLQVGGIPRERHQPYKWIEEAFMETYGRIYADRLVAPGGHFIFRR